MDKISKLLEGLSDKELERIKSTLNLLLSKKFDNLDIKKLKGRKDIFRVRRGNFRIIYRMNKEKIYILAIEKRNERTYKKSSI